MTSKLNILDAIRFILDSWSKVTQETIQNYWFHNGVMTCKQDVNNTVSEENLALKMLFPY